MWYESISVADKLHPTVKIHPDQGLLYETIPILNNVALYVFISYIVLNSILFTHAPPMKCVTSVLLIIFNLWR